jgi:hypothetical protein
MKQNRYFWHGNRRTVRRAAACLAAALAVGLACGCASHVADFTGDESENAAYAGEATGAGSTLLDDGVLRLFSKTVLCGPTVLYSGTPSDALALITDELSGEAMYYLVTANQADGTRNSILYDKTGAAVYDCGVASNVQLAGGTLLVYDYITYSDMASDESNHFRFVDLGTGAVTPCPDGTVRCVADGDGYWFITVQEDTLTGEPLAEDDSYDYWAQIYARTLYICDSSLRLTQTVEHCEAATGSRGWTYLDHYTMQEDGTCTYTTELYRPATGERIEDFYNFCGEDLVCVKTEAGLYQVRSLSNFASGEVLAEYEDSCDVYLAQAGLALLWRHDPYGSYALVQTEDGQTVERAVQDKETSGTLTAVLFADGELCVYDSAADSGTPLLDVELQAPEGTARTYVAPSAGGYVTVTYYNDEYATIGQQIYGPQGLCYDSNADENGRAYRNLYYLMESEDGPLFEAYYQGPGGISLDDILNAQGEVVISGLGYAYTLDSAPEGCFAARRGFYQGWMRTDGAWAYCESVFASLSDEDGDSLWW